MKDDKFERFSALIDGEITEQESGRLMMEIRNDKEIYDTLARYFLIGDTVRHNLPASINPDFPMHVAKTISEESVLAEPSRRRSRLPVNIWAVGGALAASVAAAAVLVYGLNESGLPDDGQSQSALPANTLAHEVLSESQPTTAPPRIDVGPQGRGLAATSWLDSYLVNHNQYQTNFGMPVVAPYARLVGYDSNR